MTIQELFDEYVSVSKDYQVSGVRQQQIIQEVEALVRKETIEEVLKLPTTQQLHNDGTLDEPKVSEYEIIKFALSKGVILD